MTGFDRKTCGMNRSWTRTELLCEFLTSHFTQTGLVSLILTGRGYNHTLNCTNDVSNPSVFPEAVDDTEQQTEVSVGCGS